MKFVASHGGLKVPGDAAATATVDIAPRGGRRLRPDHRTVSIAVPGVPRVEVEALVARARQVRPWSGAARNTVDVKRTLE
jgi:organic hydroperoxide reductase OsmC/OhrA